MIDDVSDCLPFAVLLQPRLVLPINNIATLATRRTAGTNYEGRITLLCSILELRIFACCFQAPPKKDAMDGLERY